MGGGKQNSFILADDMFTQLSFNKANAEIALRLSGYGYPDTNSCLGSDWETEKVWNVS